MKTDRNLFYSAANGAKRLAALLAPMVLLTACSTPPEADAPVVSATAGAQAARPAAAKAPAPPASNSTNAPAAATDQVDPVSEGRVEDPALPQLLSGGSPAKRGGILSLRNSLKWRMTSGYYDDAMGRASDFGPYVYYDHQHVNLLNTLLR